MSIFSKIMSFVASDRFKFYVDEIARLEALVAKRKQEQELAAQEAAYQEKIKLLRKEAGVE